MTTQTPETSWRAAAAPRTQELPRIVDAPTTPATTQPPASGRWVWVPERRPTRRSQGAGAWMAIGALIATILVVLGAIIALVMRYVVPAIQEASEDPGVAACRDMLTAFQADAQVDPAVYRLLQESRDPNLRISGAAFERFLALPEEDRRERLAGLSDLITAVGNLGVGCEAVGVPLPPEMLQMQPG